jgi:hypothetical protein
LTLVGIASCGGLDLAAQFVSSLSVSDLWYLHLTCAGVVGCLPGASQRQSLRVQRQSLRGDLCRARFSVARGWDGSRSQGGAKVLAGGCATQRDAVLLAQAAKLTSYVQPPCPPACRSSGAAAPLPVTRWSMAQPGFVLGAHTHGGLGRVR